MEMEHTTETHPPLWHKTKGLDVPTLTRNLNTDVCIVGAGISGLTTAYHLLKKGLRIVVIDRKDLNDGETGHTSAHLSNALDDGFQKIKNIFGIAGLKLAFESHSRAIDEIEHICRAENIKCDLRIESYFLKLKQGC